MLLILLLVLTSRDPRFLPLIVEDPPYRTTRQFALSVDDPVVATVPANTLTEITNPPYVDVWFKAPLTDGARGLRVWRIGERCGVTKVLYDDERDDLP